MPYYWLIGEDEHSKALAESFKAKGYLDSSAPSPRSLSKLATFSAAPIAAAGADADDTDALVIIDLSATGKFQKSLDGGIIFNHLKERNLLDKITRVDFCASELDFGEHTSTTILAETAEELTEKIYEECGSFVSVRVPSDNRYDFSILVPPQVGFSEKWQLFCLRKSMLPPASIHRYRFNIDFFQKIAAKRILGERDALHELLNEKSRIIKPFAMLHPNSSSVRP